MLLLFEHFANIYFIASASVYNFILLHMLRDILFKIYMVDTKNICISFHTPRDSFRKEK